MPTHRPDPGFSDDPRTLRVVGFFEQLSPASLATLGEVYHPDAHFKDPFNTVQGVRAVHAIFAHMFNALEGPRFEVVSALTQHDQAFLSWDFHFSLRGRALRIHGASHLHYAADGRVLRHRDYWDAAEELYEKLPLLGALMRALKRRLACPTV
jgi:ketosteroid isomerase-like protein